MGSAEWSAAHRARLVLVRAYLLIHEDPQRFLEVVRAAADDRDATARVSVEYGVERSTATAMVDTQFRIMTQESHRRLVEELASLERLSSEEEDR